MTDDVDRGDVADEGRAVISVLARAAAIVSMASRGLSSVLDAQEFDRQAEAMAQRMVEDVP